MEIRLFGFVQPEERCYGWDAGYGSYDLEHELCI